MKMFISRVHANNEVGKAGNKQEGKQTLPHTYNDYIVKSFTVITRYQWARLLTHVHVWKYFLWIYHIVKVILKSNEQ